MRTKTTVLSAALFAAGALSSMAQSAVYSQNVVGYVTVTVPAYDGVHATFALLANPFDDGKGNYLTNVISGDDGSGNFALVPDGTDLFYYKNTPGNSGFQNTENFVQGPGGGWGSGTQIPCGSAFFVQSGTTDGGGIYGPSFTVTFVGNVQQGSLSQTLNTGYNLVGSSIPVAIPVGSKGDINTAGPNDPTAPTLQMPTFDFDTIFLYTNNAAASGYGDSPSYQFGGGWSSLTSGASGPTNAPGYGFWFYRGLEDADANGNAATSTSNGNQTWAYTFTVQ